MTLAAAIPIKRYDGNGSTTNFPFPYQFDATDELVVEHLSLAGIPTTAVLDTDYTVNGVGTVTGSIDFNIGSTYTSPLPTGESITIYRKGDLDQLIDYINNTLLLSTMESSFDHIMKILQEFQEQLNRTAQYLPTNSDTPPNLEDLEAVAETDQMKVFQFQLYDSTASVGTGNGIKFASITDQFDGWTVVGVRPTVATKGITGTTDIQLRKKKILDDSEVDVLSPVVTLGDERTIADGVIDATKNTLSTGDILFIDIDAVHSGTAPLGLDVDVTIQAPAT